ncbi:MAG: DeoR/GlpR transcriptional regulator [Chitinophagaceae bacterium]|nr:MAG: DeoR/GlpR transcriptional regulator [Chitinophagaceae bacterium]
MLKKERQAFILRQIDLHNKVLSSGLCLAINVSEDTIRRDLQELADDGKLIKVHGGALSHSFNQFHYPSNNVYAQSQKQIVARKAVSLINDGMFVLTSGGTTLLELARCLPPELKATFITGSIPIVQEYMNHPNIDVIVIGDRVSKSAKITTGGEALAKIRQIRADICLLGINAINVQDGITDNDWDVVQLKKAMIESSQKVVCVTIAEKLNSLQPIHVSALSEIDILITELSPNDPVLQPYREAGVTII